MIRVRNLIHPYLLELSEGNEERRTNTSLKIKKRTVIYHKKRTFHMIVRRQIQQKEFENDIEKFLNQLKTRIA